MPLGSIVITAWIAKADPPLGARSRCEPTEDVAGQLSQELVGSLRSRLIFVLGLGRRSSEKMLHGPI